MRLPYTELIGRSQELRQLEDQWARAQSGSGGAVVIVGEAGIGKSRLAIELEQRVKADRPLFLRFHGSPQRANTGLHPVLDHLFRVAGIRRDDPVQVKAAKIGKMLATTGAAQPSTQFLQALVDLGSEPAAWQDSASPVLRRDAVVEALLRGTAEMASARPLLIIVEDAQWLDPTTLEFLHALIQRSLTQRLLIVITARREFEAAWLGTPVAALIFLRRLNSADTKILAGSAAGGVPLSPQQLQIVADRSEGVPLFAEELAREVATQGAEACVTARVSAGVQEVLIARIDGLGEARRLAQFASAIGRRFGHDVGLLLWGQGAETFAQSIERLMAQEILLPAPVAGDAVYTFRHALLQDAAYATLSVQERQDIHARIVAAFENHRHVNSADQPEILAYHCDRAGLPLKAAAYRLEAGKGAALRGSVVESVNEFKLGIAAARIGATGVAREQLLFELNLSLGPALMAYKGYTCSDGLDAFLQARERLHLSRSSIEQVHVFLGLFNVHFGRGELSKALAVARQADEALSIGYGGYPFLLGQTLCMMGQFPEARRCLEDALAKYDPSLDAQSGLFCRADVVATSFLAKTEFALGNVERSAALTRAAMTLAQQQGHPVALAIAFMGAMFFATEAGELDQAKSIADEALAHATRHGISNYVLWIAFHRAVLSLRADPGAAVAAMERLIDEAHAAGTLMFRATQLGLLGVGYGSLGRHEDALELIEQGIATAQQTGGLEALPALLRQRAKALGDLDRSDEALRDVEQSLAIALGQSARMEELRAATILARMLKGTDHGGHALDRLATLVAQFEKDLEFPDLRYAVRTLATLGKYV